MDNKDKLIPDNVSSEEYGRQTLEAFMRLAQDTPDNRLANDRVWKDMYEEFNLLQASKDNKIPRSEFESRYSIFFNRDNVKSFRHKSSVGMAWQDRSEEFLRRIDPYRPWHVVDDYDHDKILKTFPPLFREIDTLNVRRDRIDIRDESGAPVDSAMLAGVVNNIFDKYSTHQMQYRRQEGVMLLKNCILAMQDKKRLVEDVAATDAIIAHFYRQDGTGRTTQMSIDTDTREISTEDVEDFGIVYE